MEQQQHEWMVVTRGEAPACLIVHCKVTGTVGKVHNPTAQEWSAAAWASADSPLDWTGGVERVELVLPLSEQLRWRKRLAKLRDAAST